MHVCVVTACARVLWPRPDIYCNYYVRAKFKPGGAPGCYDARGNTDKVYIYIYIYVHVRNIQSERVQYSTCVHVSASVSCSSRPGTGSLDFC